MKQQNKNFIFNVGYQLLMYLIPLLSAGYISRVLGADGLGLFSYINSIATMFGMFSLLGISNYGNREVAKIRDDRAALSEKFSSIYTLQLILSVFVLLVYVATVFVFLFEHKTIYFIQIIHFVSIACDVTWLFFGLEKFKITLTRSFVVRLISLVLVFLFVKSPDDVWLYTLITVASTLVSQLVMLVLSSKYVDFKVTSVKKAFTNFKSCLILFVPVLAYNIYRIMDKTMIGAISTKAELAFYENAERLINIPIMVIAALGTVMLPHMSHAIHNKTEDYKKTIRFSMKLALIIACYSALGLALVGKDLCVLIFGSEYSFSGVLLLPLSATIIASAWANVIRTQYLIPNSHDKIYVTSTIIGAVINLICNIIFIRFFGAAGACIGTVLAEFSIVFYQTYFVRHELEIKKYFFDFLISFIKAVLTIVVAFIPALFIDNIYLRLGCQVFIAVALFVALNFKFIFHEFLGIKRKSKNNINAES